MFYDTGQDCGVTGCSYRFEAHAHAAPGEIHLFPQPRPLIHAPIQPAPAEQVATETQALVAAATDTIATQAAAVRAAGDRVAKLAAVLGPDLAGRPFAELLQQAAQALEAAGGGPLVTALLAKAAEVEAVQVAADAPVLPTTETPPAWFPVEFSITGMQEGPAAVYLRLKSCLRPDQPRSDVHEVAQALWPTHRALLLAFVPEVPPT